MLFNTTKLSLPKLSMLPNPSLQRCPEAPLQNAAEHRAERTSSLLHWAAASGPLQVGEILTRPRSPLLPFNYAYRPSESAHHRSEGARKGDKVFRRSKSLEERIGRGFPDLSILLSPISDPKQPRQPTLDRQLAAFLRRWCLCMAD